MTCENNLCIYCNNNSCILNDISINSLGMCDECILINLNSEILKAEKQKMFDKFD